MEIRIKTDELKKLNLTLKQLAAGVEKVTRDRSFLSLTGQLLVSRGKTNLEEGGYGGKSYKLLTLRTLRQKTRKGYSPKPLQRMGFLKRSLNYSISNGGGLTVRGIEIAKHHQYGAPRANIPARPIYTQDPEDMGEIQDYIIRRFKQQIPDIK